MAAEYSFLRAGNYRLTANSPCVNAGTNLPWMAGAEDLDGGQRILNGRVDIGAFEYGSVTYSFICLNTDIVDFGKVIIWNENVQTVTVQNVGGGTLTGEVTGAVMPFSVVSGTPYSLEESDETFVVLRFSPSGKETYSNTVAFTGGGDAAVLLIGTGIPEPGFYLLFIIYQLLFIKLKLKS